MLEKENTQDPRYLHAVEEMVKLGKQILDGAIIIDEPEDFRAAVFKSGKTAVEIALDINPQESGQVMEVELFGTPLRDENHRWFMPTTTFTLDSDNQLSRTYNTEDDLGTIKRRLDPEIWEMLDIDGELDKPSVTANIIADEDEKRSFIQANFQRFVLEPVQSSAVAAQLGLSVVSLSEIETDILSPLRAIAANPQQIAIED